jgi:hypothetical protein
MRLWQSCPQMELVGPDPKFPQLLLRMWEAVCWLILPWIETWQLLTAGLEPAGEAALADKARRRCREWSDIWTGIEAGLDRFCAEVDLLHAQLLAIGYPLSPVIEQARHLLDSDGHRPPMQRRRLPTAPVSLGG